MDDELILEDEEIPEEIIVPHTQLKTEPLEESKDELFVSTGIENLERSETHRLYFDDQSVDNGPKTDRRNAWNLIDDVLDEELTKISLSVQQRAKQTYEMARSRSLVDKEFQTQINFYKSLPELPKHDLIKDDYDLKGSVTNKSIDAIEILKENKCINTSEEVKEEVKKPSTSDKVGDLVNCPICLDMIEDAMETPCCHNIFCEKCIILTDICPICCQGYNIHELIPNIPMRRLINEIVITCPNEDCENQVTKANLEKHLTECEYSLVKCPYSDVCKQMLRKDLEEHTNMICEYRTIECILMCGKSIQLKELYDHIHRVCPKSLIPCKNNCGEVVERGELLYHVNSKCKFEVISCMYKQTLIYQNGCDIKLKRCDMKDHIAQCPFRVTKCKNHGCNKKLAYKDYKEHDLECIHKEISCRNNCGSTFQRKYEIDHFDQCELQIIQCPYYEYGCKTDLLRKNYMSHLKSEAFAHSLQFVEGQNKKNEEMETMKHEMHKMKEEFKTKIDDIMAIVGLQNKRARDDEERAREEEKDKNNNNFNFDASNAYQNANYGDKSSLPGIAPPSDNLYSLKFSNDSDYQQDDDEYSCDEFESDYSYDF